MILICGLVYPFSFPFTILVYLLDLLCSSLSVAYIVIVILQSKAPLTVGFLYIPLFRFIFSIDILSLLLTLAFVRLDVSFQLPLVIHWKNHHIVLRCLHFILLENRRVYNCLVDGCNFIYSRNDSVRSYSFCN